MGMILLPSSCMGKGSDYSNFNACFLPFHPGIAGSGACCSKLPQPSNKVGAVFHGCLSLYGAQLLLFSVLLEFPESIRIDLGELKCLCNHNYGLTAKCLNFHQVTGAVMTIALGTSPFVHHC